MSANYCPECYASVSVADSSCPDCGRSTTEPPNLTIEPGICLAGRFSLVRQIGRGGVGNIWEAKDIRLDNDPIACKVLRDDLRNSRCAVADLKREVLLTRKLRHAHIQGKRI